MWFSCTETYWWSVHTSSSFVINWCWHFFCGKYSRISIVFLIIYWCWLFFMCKMFLSFSTDVYVIFCYWNISMKCTHFILICHLLMLTYFLCGKYSRISILVLIIYWCWLFFMCKMFLSFSTDVYVIFCYWNISMKCTHFILICHLLMFFCVTYFLCGKYSDWFWLFTDVYFSCAKCSYHSQLMFMWFSVTETYQWSARTSSWFVIYWCWHIFCVENILEFQYWFWLFTDVDYFSCAKCSYHSRLMFMWFSVTETYQWSARTSSWFVIY